MDTLTENTNSPRIVSTPPTIAPKGYESSKTIEVSFTEQAKAVVASVSVRVSHNSPYNSQEVLKEAEELFAEAYKTSKRYTFDKNR